MRNEVLLGFAAAITCAGCSDALLSVDDADLHGAATLDGTRADDADVLMRPDDAHGLPVFAVDISHWSGPITDTEVACWYEKGVRHVIVGTQVEEISRQQLEQAIEGGMSVDGYVYLDWRGDLSGRVADDVAMLNEYPIGRVWLDIEENPAGLGTNALTTRIGEALNACGDTPCGIYTGAWWWDSAMHGAEAFPDVPLWYSWYDENPSLGTWATQAFGGWEKPWGKQWQETYFCGIDVDKSTIFVDAQPTSEPKTFEPAAGPLGAPTGLYPTDLESAPRPQNIRILTDAVPGATGYDFEVEHWSGRWAPYTTYHRTPSAARFSAVVLNRVFRFRARATRSSEVGPWSIWSYFIVGNATEIPADAVEPQTPVEPAQPAQPAQPDESTEPAPPTTTEPPAPEPADEPAGAPVGLSPADGATFSGSVAVTLACDPVSAANGYEWEVQNFYDVQNDWVAYYTYSTGAAQRLFYPRAGLAYRWRVRAKQGATFTPWTSWHGFDVTP